MKLVDLDPRWLVKDGRRVGFTFVSPTNPKWRQSCFAEKLQRREQWALFGDDVKNTQGVFPLFAWTIVDGIDGATFETISVMPSIDGSAGGLWHGFIKNGEIK